MSADNLSTLAGNRRDPRVNPKRGDVLRNNVGEVEIAQVHPFEAVGMFPDTSKRVIVRVDEFERPMSIGGWRKWSETAEVLHNADDDATTSPVAQQKEESSEGL